MGFCYAVFHKQLGDLLLLEPTFARLAGHYGGVRVLTRGGHADLLALMPHTQLQRGAGWRPSRVAVAFDARSKSVLRAAVLPAARKHLLTPDAVRADGLAARMVFGSRQAPGLGETYVAEYFFRHLPLPPGPEFRPPALNRPPDQWRPAGMSPGHLLVNPTSGWKRKLWTSAAWAEFLEAVEPGGAVVMTSGGQAWQTGHCGRIRERCRREIASLAAGTTLREYLWLVANARMVLTVDGAASHLAAAFGVPCVTLFGPTSERNWHWPSGGQVAVAPPTPPAGARTLKSLAAADVLSAARAAGLEI